MKSSQLSDLTVAELSVKGRSLRQELFNLRLQKATAQLDKPTRMRTLRKDIARIETRLTQLKTLKVQHQPA